mgnify:CR=1 FL=1|tara:strand:+ start:13751 stop:14677 length:927 start_codon:yes stop_codon:yes gene_type:complete
MKNGRGRINKNKERRYRLQPHTALKLGLEPKEYNKYTLTIDQEKQLFGFDQEKIKRLFFDIETAPMIVYSWRVGYKLNIPTDNIIEDWKIICISYKWEGDDTVRNLTWDKDQCDKQMLIDFIKIANEADEIIAHNGDRFDIKKIRTRCIFHRIPMFPNYRSLDTLKKAKAGFSFNSNRLDYIARFLGVGQKVEHEGFDMWVKCLKGDEQALKDMVHYCDGDIVVLEDVYFVLQNYIKNNTHVGTHNGKLKASCPGCGSEDISLLKNNFTALGTIKRLIECNTCGYDYETSNSAWRTFLEMKQNEKIAI